MMCTLRNSNLSRIFWRRTGDVHSLNPIGPPFLSLGEILLTTTTSGYFCLNYQTVLMTGLEPVTSILSGLPSKPTDIHQDIYSEESLTREIIRRTRTEISRFSYLMFYLLNYMLKFWRARSISWWLLSELRGALGSNQTRVLAERTA